MEGPSILDPTSQGVIPRAAADIFAHVHAVRAGANGGGGVNPSGGGDTNSAVAAAGGAGSGAVNLSVRVSVSYIEIYLERIRDLLDASGARNNLQVRENPKHGVFVDGCTAEDCATEADLTRVFAAGADRKSTRLNSSHRR